MKSRKEILSNHIRLILAVVGLVLIFVGNTFCLTVYKVDIGSLISNVGALVLVVGLLQWLFDEHFREEIVRDISAAALGSEHIFKEGIRDCTTRSSEIRENAIWKSSSCLVVGHQYSNRFLSNNIDVIRRRIDSGLETTLLHIKPDCLAAKYIEESNSGASINAKTDEMKKIISDEFRDDKLLKTVWIDRVLRYSFVKTDQVIWVKFYTNAAGKSYVPAIKVGINSPMYNFFDEDINKIMEQAID